MKPQALLLAVLLALLLSGCGLWNRDTSESPAPLPEITATQPMKTLWERNTGGGSGRFYVQLKPFLDGEAIYVAQADGGVSAYALADGAPRWAVRLGEPLTGGVNGGGEIVVVGTANGDAVALLKDSGGELWRTRLSSEVMAFSNASRDLVVARTHDGRLHALDTQTGAVLWVISRTTPPLSLRGVNAPLLLPGRVLAGFDNGRVAMFSVARGQLLWETALAIPSGRTELERMVDVDGWMIATPQAIFAVSYQGRVAALNTNDGRLFWERPFSSYRGLDTAGRELYLTDAFGHLWALDAQNGATLWQQDALRLRRATAPVVWGNYVAVGDYQGYIHLLDREDGSLQGQIRADPRGIEARPVVHEDILYVLGKSGRLSAIAQPELRP